MQAGGIDISALEKAFVKVGKSYAGRKSISYAAFREFGVPADVLKRGHRPPAPEPAWALRASGGVATGAGAGRAQERLEEHDAVGRAEQRIARALGMRHQPDDVAALVADAGDVVEAAVRVVDVAHDDAVVGPQPLERRRVAHVVALEVIDRHAQVRAPARPGSSARCAVGLDPQLDRLAQELQPAFFCNAPGSRPASVSTWKPLQTPTTGPPAAANSRTASITGEKRAIAPVRR